MPERAVVKANNVFPPAPKKKGMVKFSRKGHFQRIMTCQKGTFSTHQHAKAYSSNFYTAVSFSLIVDAIFVNTSQTWVNLNR